MAVTQAPGEPFLPRPLLPLPQLLPPLHPVVAVVLVPARQVVALIRAVATQVVVIRAAAILAVVTLAVAVLAVAAVQVVVALRDGYLAIRRCANLFLT